MDSPGRRGTYTVSLSKRYGGRVLPTPRVGAYSTSPKKAATPAPSKVIPTKSVVTHVNPSTSMSTPSGLDNPVKKSLRGGSKFKRLEAQRSEVDYVPKPRIHTPPVSAPPVSPVKKFSTESNESPKSTGFAEKDDSQRLPPKSTEPISSTESTANDDGQRLPPKQRRIHASTVLANDIAKGVKHPMKMGPFDTRSFSSISKNKAAKSVLPDGAADFNRYSDVLPNPDTRVKLGNTDPDTASGYINANWVKGFTGYAHEYIAAQGPMQNTVNSFWQMIWESRTKAIVMVTGLVERGSEKCARYWPMKFYNDEKGVNDETYGKVNVRLVSAEKHDGFVMGRLEVRCGEQIREIRHYWYTSWPDHGVPETTKQLTQLRATVRKWSDAVDAPWVVHCSAGVGRSGTFIAIDYGINKLEFEGTCDVVDIIRDLRTCRTTMVQHVGQAEFVYKALQSYVRSRSGLVPRDPEPTIEVLAEAASRRALNEESEVVPATSKTQRTSLRGPRQANKRVSTTSKSVATPTRKPKSSIRRESTVKRSVAAPSAKWAKSKRPSGGRIVSGSMEPDKLADAAEMKARRAEQRVKEATSQLDRFDKNSGGKNDRRRDQLLQEVHAANKRFYTLKKQWKQAAEVAGRSDSWPPTSTQDNHRVDDLLELEGRLHEAEKRIASTKQTLQDFTDHPPPIISSQNRALAELDTQLKEAQQRVDEAEEAVVEHDAHPPRGSQEDVDCIRAELTTTASIARKKFNKLRKKYEVAALHAGQPTAWPATRGSVPAPADQPPFECQDDIDCYREELAQDVVIATKKFNKMRKKWIAWREAAGMSPAWPPEDDADDSGEVELTPQERVESLEAELKRRDVDVKRAVAAVVEFKIKSGALTYEEIDARGTNLNKVLATARLKRDETRKALDSAMRDVQKAETARTARRVAPTPSPPVSDPQIDREAVLAESLAAAEREADFLEADVHDSQRPSVHEDDDEISDSRVAEADRQHRLEKYDKKAGELEDAINALKTGSRANAAALHKYRRELDLLKSKWESDEGERVLQKLDEKFDSAYAQFHGKPAQQVSPPPPVPGPVPAIPADLFKETMGGRPTIGRVAPELDSSTDNWSSCVSEMMSNGGASKLRHVTTNSAPKNQPKIVVEWQKEGRQGWPSQIKKAQIETPARAAPRSSRLEVAEARARILNAKRLNSHRRVSHI